MPWLFCLALAEEAGTPDPLAGQKWIQQSLKSAKSPAVQLDAAAFALQRLVAGEALPQADAVIARAAIWAQLPEDHGKVESWKKQSQAVRQNIARTRIQDEVVRERVQIEGELAFLKSQAEQAKKMHRSAADLASLASAVSAAQAKLDGLPKNSN